MHEAKRVNGEVGIGLEVVSRWTGLSRALRKRLAVLSLLTKNIEYSF
jgi:hypothetical protein